MMTITVWSDIRCPFCYIAKRRLENAISQFKYKNEVNVEWKSFELDPMLKTNTSLNVIDHYVNHGVSRNQITELFSNAKCMAQEVGINIDLDKLIVANSFRAHVLLHIAKEFKVESDAKESLFKAYFSEGLNIDDSHVLINIGKSLGLNSFYLEKKLKDKNIVSSVNQDKVLAEKLGVTSVPFFTFNNRLSFSGAQSESAFLEALETSYEPS